MTADPIPAEQTPAKQPPFFTAPTIVLVAAALLIALHAAYSFASFDAQGAILYDFALAPERFWAPAGSPKVYPDAAAGFVTLLSTGLLHGDWLHVIVNSMMLLALGAPVARALGQDITGAGLWMLLFVVSILGGSALYLALADVNTPYAVGASGGVSGMFAAAFLLDPDGGKRRLWSRPFLSMTVAFAVANLLLAAVGPYVLGAGIAWQAHAGGYLAGALLMAVLPVRGYRLAGS